jgi:hypothetical protein
MVWLYDINLPWKPWWDVECAGSRRFGGPGTRRGPFKAGLQLNVSQAPHPGRRTAAVESEDWSPGVWCQGRSLRQSAMVNSWAIWVSVSRRVCVNIFRTFQHFPGWSSFSYIFVAFHAGHFGGYPIFLDRTRWWTTAVHFETFTIRWLLRGQNFEPARWLILARNWDPKSINLFRFDELLDTYHLQTRHEIVVVWKLTIGLYILLIPISFPLLVEQG